MTTPDNVCEIARALLEHPASLPFGAAAVDVLRSIAYRAVPNASEDEITFINHCQSFIARSEVWA